MKKLDIFLITTLYGTICYSAANNNHTVIRESEIIGVASREGMLAMKRGYVDASYICAVAYTVKNHINQAQLQTIADVIFVEMKEGVSKGHEILTKIFAPRTRPFSLRDEVKTHLSLAVFKLHEDTLCSLIIHMPGFRLLRGKSYSADYEEHHSWPAYKIADKPYVARWIGEEDSCAVIISMPKKSEHNVSLDKVADARFESAPDWAADGFIALIDTAAWRRKTEPIDLCSML